MELSLSRARKVLNNLSTFLEDKKQTLVRKSTIEIKPYEASKTPESAKVLIDTQRSQHAELNAVVITGISYLYTIRSLIDHRNHDASNTPNGISISDMLNERKLNERLIYVYRQNIRKVEQDECISADLAIEKAALQYNMTVETNAARFSMDSYPVSAITHDSYALYESTLNKLLRNDRELEDMISKANSTLCIALPSNIHDYLIINNLL